MRAVDNLCEQEDGLRLSRPMVSGRHRNPHVDAIPRRASTVTLPRLDLRLIPRLLALLRAVYREAKGRRLYNAAEPLKQAVWPRWVLTTKTEIETPPSASSAPISICVAVTTSMRAAGARRLGIVEVGQRSIRNFVGHSMPTFASALAYQGLLALFPFVIFVGLLLVVLQVDGFFDRLIEQAR